MKKAIKILFSTLGILIGLLILIVGITMISISVKGNRSAKRSMALVGPEVQTITVDGQVFRDLNKNGTLDPYEDKRCSTE
jgi:hypothetical protein